jgi:hypothetical protein
MPKIRFTKTTYQPDPHEKVVHRAANAHCGFCRFAVLLDD